MSLITLGLRLVNLKGSLDKHLYTYTKDSSRSPSFDAGQGKWQQLLSLFWEFQLSAAVPVLAEEKNRLWIFRRKRLIWASSWMDCVVKTKRMFPEPAEGMIPKFVSPHPLSVEY